MNCIDCEQVFTCKLANEEVRQCDNFKNAHRKIVRLENVDYKKMAKEMLEDE